MKRSSRSTGQCSVYAAIATLTLGLTLGAGPRAAYAATCVGDCNTNAAVTNDELLTMTDVALGSEQLSTCANGDKNGSGTITVDEIVAGVDNTLGQTPCIMVGGTPPPGTCGDGVKNGAEECDNGGVCVGGDNAGTACTAESQCTGTGVCLNGANAEHECTGDTDCPDSTCVHCKPVGGDGCASNCTNEHDVPVNLVNGVVNGLDIKPGTSGAVVHGDVLTIPLPLVGTQVLTVGNDNGDHIVPFVMKAANVNLPRIPVSTIACACVRAIPAKTCGGALFDTTGALSTDCSDGFVGASACTGKKPCAFVHGSGNAASGAVGCGAAGLTGTDLNWEQSCGGSSGAPGPVLLTFSGSGPEGSAIILNSSAIGTVVGACTGTDKTMYGMDGEFCTEDDPIATRGIVATLPQVTGTATGTVHNANGEDGADIGPFAVTGHIFNCAAVASGSASGGALVGTFTTCGQATVGDIVVTNQFVVQ